ncbi:hypothetical protein IAU60_000048 [Kwoniella sp. DSM 27419]
MLITTLVRSKRASLELVSLGPRALHSSVRCRDDESGRLRDLMAKFQNPSSHYHIPEGTTGPAHEDDHSTSRDPTIAEQVASTILAPRTAAKLGLQPSRADPQSADRPPRAPRPHPLAGDRPRAPTLGQPVRERKSQPSSARLGVPETRPSIIWSEPAADMATEEDSSVARTRTVPRDRPWLEDNAGRKEKAVEYFREQGYDTAGVLTWPVAWGDCDMFRHVNNVRILRWLETARVRYWESWAGQMSRDDLQNVMAGKGTGMILKDISIKYKSPITYPDTVMVTNRIHSIQPERASFGLSHIVWSLKDNRVAAVGDSTLVMYDYDNVKKGVMSGEFRQMLEGIVRTYGQPGSGH